MSRILDEHNQTWRLPGEHLTDGKIAVDTREGATVSACEHDLAESVRNRPNG